MTRRPSLLVVLALVVLAAAPAMASRATRRCVATSCRPAAQACMGGFRALAKSALAACDSRPRRVCKRLVRQTLAKQLAACQRELQACASCCRSDGAACPIAVCGNAIIEPGEACDGSVDGDCPGRCRPDCTCAPKPAQCGNGIREGSEPCDDADDDACPGRCNASCACNAPRCGDGIVDPGEACDGAALGACEAACSGDCTCVPAVCGNGIVGGTEACEVGQDDACPGRCNYDCTCSVCGDGSTGAGEDCEPGVTDDYCGGAGCRADCTCAVCGDGIVDAPFEECDPGIGSVCPGACSTLSCRCVSPTTDTCEAPHQIEAFPVEDRQSSESATGSASDPVPSCLTVPQDENPRSIWYAFTAPGTGRVRLDTLGSTYDTVLAAYTGTCEALAEAACVDDPLDVYRQAARIDFPVTSGTDYLVAATAFPSGESEGDLVLSGDFRPCGDGVVQEGEGCEPSVPASCAAGTCSDQCECLDLPADECADAAVVTTLPIVAHVAAYAATGNASDPLLGCVFHPIVPSSAWFRFRAPADGDVTISTAGSSYDTVLGVYVGACDALVPMWCDDDGAGDYQSEITIAATAGTDYTILVTSYGKLPAARLDLHVFQPAAP